MVLVQPSCWSPTPTSESKVFFPFPSDSKWQTEESHEKKGKTAQTRGNRMWNNQRREETRGKQRKEWKRHTSKRPPSSLGALESNKKTKCLLFSPRFTWSFFHLSVSRCLQTFATTSLQEICRPTRPCSFNREPEQRDRQMAEEKGCGGAIWGGGGMKGVKNRSE